MESEYAIMNEAGVLATEIECNTREMLDCTFGRSVLEMVCMADGADAVTIAARIQTDYSPVVLQTDREFKLSARLLGEPRRVGCASRSSGTE